MTQKTKYQKVKEFHEAFNIDMPVEPTPLYSEDLLNRMDFLTEEVLEALHATSNDYEHFRFLFFELIERMFKHYQKLIKKPIPEEEDTLLAQLDAIVDQLYFTYGTATLMGLDPDRAFDIVHRANMGKLFPDGKPRYNEHGKVVKPENWERDYAPEPLLKEEIQRQIEQSKK